MTIGADDRARMLGVPLCGERVLMRLESIGVERLSDLLGRDPWDMMFEINLQAGREIWHPPLATEALANLVEAAEQENQARLESDA